MHCDTCLIGCSNLSNDPVFQLLKKIYSFLFCVYGCCLQVCLHTTRMHAGQNVLEPQEWSLTRLWAAMWVPLGSAPSVTVLWPSEPSLYPPTILSLCLGGSRVRAQIFWLQNLCASLSFTVCLSPLMVCVRLFLKWIKMPSLSQN